MQWDEDIDLLVVKKSAPKQGRRSNKNLEDTEIIQESPKEMEDVRSKTRKTGVWSDEPLKTSRSDATRNIIELERFQNDKKTDINDDIPIIPDIDDDVITSAISVDKSVKEIDSQISSFKMDQNKVWMLGDIDLSCLTSKLYPEKDVQECAEEWTLDSLFNDLLINTELN